MINKKAKSKNNSPVRSSIDVISSKETGGINSRVTNTRYTVPNHDLLDEFIDMKRSDSLIDQDVSTSMDLNKIKSVYANIQERQRPQTQKQGRSIVQKENIIINRRNKLASAASRPNMINHCKSRSKSPQRLTIDYPYD